MTLRNDTGLKAIDAWYAQRVKRPSRFPNFFWLDTAPWPLQSCAALIPPPRQPMETFLLEKATVGGHFGIVLHFSTGFYFNIVFHSNASCHFTNSSMGAMVDDWLLNCMAQPLSVRWALVRKVDEWLIHLFFRKHCKNKLSANTMLQWTLHEKVSTWMVTHYLSKKRFLV